MTAQTLDKPGWYCEMAISKYSARNIKIAELVTIDLNDGSMTFGPDYSPDAAARRFWEAMSDEYREMLRWKNRQGA